MTLVPKGKEEPKSSSDVELGSLSSRSNQTHYTNGIPKSTTLTAYDINLLNSNQFINDEIINTALKIILFQQTNHHHFNTYFLPILLENSPPRLLTWRNRLTRWGLTNENYTFPSATEITTGY